MKVGRVKPQNRYAMTAPRAVPLRGKTVRGGKRGAVSQLHSNNGFRSVDIRMSKVKSDQHLSSQKYLGQDCSLLLSSGSISRVLPMEPLKDDRMNDLINNDPCTRSSLNNRNRQDKPDYLVLVRRPEIHRNSVLLSRAARTVEARLHKVMCHMDNTDSTASHHNRASTGRTSIRGMDTVKPVPTNMVSSRGTVR